MVVNSCDGTTTSDTSGCSTCRGICQSAVEDPNGNGQYISSPCTGPYNNDWTCTRCSGTCGIGNYIDTKCSGVSTHDRTCSKCKTQCPPGSYIYGTCDGLQITDTTICVSCPTCTGAFSLNFICDGTGTVPSACIACPPTCGSDEYVDSICGTGVPVKCKACTPACTSGYTETQPCGPTANRVCRPSTTCTEDCPALSYQTSICNDMNIPKICTVCASCLPGYYRLSTCTSVSDISCAPCKKNCLHNIETISGSTTYANSIYGTCDGTTYTDAVYCYKDPTPMHLASVANSYSYRSFTKIGAHTREVGYSAAVNPNYNIIMKISPSGKKMLIYRINYLYAFDIENNSINNFAATSNVRMNFADWVPGSEINDELILMGFPITDGSLLPELSFFVHTTDEQHVILFFDRIRAFSYKCPFLDTRSLLYPSGELWPSPIDMLRNCEYFLQYPDTHSGVMGTPYGCVTIKNSWIVCIVSSADSGLTEIRAFDTDGHKYIVGHIWNSILLHNVPSSERIRSLQIAYNIDTNTIYWLVVSYENKILHKYHYLAVRSMVISTVTTTSNGLGSCAVLSTDLSKPYTTAATGVYNDGMSWTGEIKTFFYDKSRDSLISMQDKVIAIFTSPFNTNYNDMCIYSDCSSTGNYNAAITNNGGIVTITELGDINQFSNFLPCPDRSECPPSSTSLSACTCPSGTYGSITSRDSICYDCTKQEVGDSCGLGSYSTGNICVAGSTSDVTCAACTTVCSPNSYVKDACTGSQTSNTATCTPCRTSCAVGFYVNPDSTCSGTTTYDAVQCLPCRTSCSTGFWLSGTCSGNGIFDNVKCIECTTCGINQHISKACSNTRLQTDHDDHECEDCQETPESCAAKMLGCNGTPCRLLTSQCLGLVTEDISANSCTLCESNCADNQYISKPCSGSSVTNFECATCAVNCDINQYISSACNGGTTTGTVCSECTLSCSEGYYKSGSCDGNGNSNEVTCQECVACQTGFHSVSPCTGDSYTDNTCIPCNTECGDGEYISQSCSSSQDITCQACKTSCATGYYMQGTCEGSDTEDNIICIPCTTCDAGYYINNGGECDGYKLVDTTTCSACVSSCSTGKYIFGSCTGSSTNDLQYCTDCKYCPDTSQATQYDSMYGSCSGTSYTDEVRCEINGKSFGDGCAANYYANGNFVNIAENLPDHIHSMRLSPNKELLAYVSENGLTIEDFSSEEINGNILYHIPKPAKLWTGIEYYNQPQVNKMDATTIFWSPDGMHLLFVIGYEIWQWETGTNTWTKRIDYAQHFFTDETDREKDGQIHGCTAYDTNTRAIICRIDTRAHWRGFFTFNLKENENDCSDTITKWGPDNPLTDIYWNWEQIKLRPIVVKGVSNPQGSEKEVFAAVDSEYTQVPFSMPKSEIWYITNDGNNYNKLPPSTVVGAPSRYYIRDIQIDSQSILYAIDGQNSVTAWAPPYTSVKYYYKDITPTWYPENAFMHIIDIWTRDRMVVLYSQPEQVTKILMWNQCERCQDMQSSPENSEGAEACKCGSGTYGSGLRACSACAATGGGDCAIGQYKTGYECESPAPATDISCAKCMTPSDCLNTQYLSGTCTGLDTSDSTQCLDCISCAPNQFVTGECAGSTNTAECNMCSTNCLQGFYLNSGSCTSRLDSTCTLCKTSCASNEVMGGICNGDSTEDQITCLLCSSFPCSTGYWADQTKCNGFNTATDICQVCTTCTSTEWEVSACSGTSDTICKSCIDTCDDGFFETSLCTTISDRQCQLCNTCSPSQYEIAECTSNANNICTLKIGEFMPKP